MAGQEEPEFTASGPNIKPSVATFPSDTGGTSVGERGKCWVDRSTNEKQIRAFYVLLMKSCGKSEEDKVSLA